MSVIWHDLECGGYAQDLALWRSLVSDHGDPVLDVGAGTGRVTLALAGDGYRVTALDRDPELLAELARRAEGLDVETVLADARGFELRQRFAVCIVPMQTIQLLGGVEGRAAFLRRAKRHLRGGGILAIAISETLDLFEVSDGAAPLPDICELGGVVYASHPTAVRSDGDEFVLERRREIVTADGARSVAQDVIRLDRLSSAQLEKEAAGSGLSAIETRTVPPTLDHVGSQVVILRA